MDFSQHVHSLRNLNVSQTEKVDTTLFPNGAPYKALILLSVFDLVRKAELPTNRIVANKRLEARFLIYKSLLSPSLVSGLALPFSALHHEPIWKLVMKNDVEYASVQRDLRSSKKLAEYVAFAQCESSFWDSLQHAEVRGVYRQTLLDSYFTVIMHPRLWEYGLS